MSEEELLRRVHSCLHCHQRHHPHPGTFIISPSAKILLNHWELGPTCPSLYFVLSVRKCTVWLQLAFFSASLLLFGGNKNFTLCWGRRRTNILQNRYGYGYFYLCTGQYLILYGPALYRWSTFLLLFFLFFAKENTKPEKKILTVQQGFYFLQNIQYCSKTDD